MGMHGNGVGKRGRCLHASMHRLAHSHTITHHEGGELSYMALAIEREQTAYRSLLMLAGTVLTDPKPMLPRLVHGCIAMAFTDSVAAVACIHRRVDTVNGGELSYMAPTMQREQTAY